MTTRTRFSQKQVMRAHEPASAPENSKAIVCWYVLLLSEIVVVAETSYHFVIGRRFKLLQKKMTLLTFLVNKKVYEAFGVYFENTRKH